MQEENETLCQKILDLEDQIREGVDIKIESAETQEQMKLLIQDLEDKDE